MSKPDVPQNAARCDICGKPLDMESGDTIATCEFGVWDETAKAEYGLTDQDARNAVADALEHVGDDGADYELARVIREHGSFCTHKSCLEKTNYTLLETETDAHE